MRSLIDAVVPVPESAARPRSPAGVPRTPDRRVPTYPQVVSHVYDIILVNRAGARRVRPFASAEQLEPGRVIRLGGRFWLVAEVRPGAAAKHLASPGSDGALVDHAIVTPARYRIRMRYPDGREELGAFRRFRADAPRLGHAFTTLDDGRPQSWSVVDERLSYDDRGEPYIELVAERDFAEAEDVPDHELEHALARSLETLSAEAARRFAHAAEAGLSLELVALEPDEAPDWAEAERFIDSLVLEEIEDDLLELCGIDPSRDPRESWLDRVKQRLRADLTSFRDDIEGDHDEIEEWDYLDGRIFASVGSPADEAEPDVGHGWLCRLVDAGVLGAAGFSRVRKAEITV
jgi:hypothetical protein